MKIGSKISGLSFIATSDLQASFESYQGTWLVLYFYPKDSTPGCTREGQDFRDHYQDFKSLNTEIFGVSRDSLKAHENFKAKHAFPFELISDPNEALCAAFDVIKMKSMYGKQVRGIERSTFIIDPNGKVCYEWRKVRVPEHVSQVLETLKALQTDS